MKRIFGKKNLIATMLVCMFVMFGFAIQTNAAGSGVEEIELYSNPEQTIKDYDVTGDGKKDTVKLVQKYNEDYSGSLKVYVNNSVVFEQKREMDPVWKVKFIQLENGKVFFDIRSTVLSDDEAIHKIYVYKKGKLKSVCDFQKNFDKYASYYTVNVVGVSGNTIKTETSAMFYLTGSVHYNMNYKYKGGQFKRTSNKFTIKYENTYQTNKWTAGRKMTAYKKAGSKKVAFTVKKGNKVKINKVIYKSKKVYIQVKKNGKTGYILCPTEWSFPQYFDEALFAG